MASTILPTCKNLPQHRHVGSHVHVVFTPRTELHCLCAVFFPAAWLIVRTLYGPEPTTRRAFSYAAILLNPATIIVDHGHFQYNCISLGFATAGAAAVGAGWHVLGSFFYCCSLNHKQMSLYYAPAFFAHLLGRCLGSKGFFAKVRLSSAVLLTMNPGQHECIAMNISMLQPHPYGSCLNISVMVLVYGKFLDCKVLDVMALLCRTLCMHLWLSRRWQTAW